MRAILITPATSTVSFIEIDSPKAIEDAVGTTWIGHQTLSFVPRFIAFVDDNGIAKKLPSISVYSPILRGPKEERRVELYGNFVIVIAGDEEHIDADDEHVKALDIIFNPPKVEIES